MSKTLKRSPFAQAFAWFSDLLADHSEIFWSLYSVDLDAALEMQPPDSWDAFPLFQLLNDYLCSDANLRLGLFHTKLINQFSPLVIRYIDLVRTLSINNKYANC